VICIIDADLYVKLLGWRRAKKVRKIDGKRLLEI